MARDLAKRLKHKVQISTDGHSSYVSAILGAFDEVDYGRLVKVYGKDSKGNDIVIRCDKEVVKGDPRIENICTSHVERSNLTMRMNMRRFTRLTNAFSKNVENHSAMINIHFLNYNLVRQHQSIKTAPAVAAGVINEPYTMKELITEFDSFRDEKYPVDRPVRYKKRSTVPKSFSPESEKTPWYLDKDSGGANPEVIKEGIAYEDDLKKFNKISK